MPLVRVDLVEGRSPEQVRRIAEDAGHGFERDADLVMIQIFTQRGRSAVRAAGPVAVPAAAASVVSAAPASAASLVAEVAA